MGPVMTKLSVESILEIKETGDSYSKDSGRGHDQFSFGEWGTESLMGFKSRDSLIIFWMGYYNFQSVSQMKWTKSGTEKRKIHIAIIQNDSSKGLKRALQLYLANAIINSNIQIWSIFIKMFVFISCTQHIHLFWVLAEFLFIHI